MASEQPLLLSVRRKLLAPLPEGTTQADRDGLWMFYAARTEPVWVDKNGLDAEGRRRHRGDQARRRLGPAGAAPSRFLCSPSRRQAHRRRKTLSPTPSSGFRSPRSNTRAMRAAAASRIRRRSSAPISTASRTLRHPLLVMTSSSPPANAPGRVPAQLHPQHRAIREAAPAVSGTPRRRPRNTIVDHPDEGLEALSGNDAQGHRARARASRRSRRRRRD